MKVVIITLLVACVLSARLTPNTKLPSAFDDFVANSLGREVIAEDRKTTKQVTGKITETKGNQLTKFVFEQIPWIAVGSVGHIVHKVKSIEVGQIQSHYIFQASKEKNTFNYCLVNLMKSEDGSVKVMVSTDSKRAVGIKKDSHFHSLEVSLFGLPTTNKTILVQQGINNEEFHKQNRDALLSAAVKARSTQKLIAKESLGMPIATVISTATAAVNALAEGWKSIVGAFKTVKTQEIKERITGEGFKQYSSKSRFIRTVGIPQSYWAQYKTNFMMLTGIAKNPIVKPEIEALLSMAKFIPDNSWNAADLSFDETTGGKLSNFVAMTRKDDVDQQFHVLATVVTGTFQLAPNIWIYNNFKSVAGGIVETQKMEIRHMPRTMTEADAKAVNAMMLLTSINVLQENFGVKKTLPDPKYMMGA